MYGSISKEDSLKTLRDIQGLKFDWNGYGAKVIPLSVVELSRKIVGILDFQPEIFPTANESIQMQYEITSNKSYLEFEICKNIIKVLIVPDRVYKNAVEYEIGISDYIKLNKIVKDFYS